MSKKKAFSGNTMTLKDFHGGSIPTDLPLPSAPGVVVRSTDRSGYDRAGSWGNSVARSDHRNRPNTSPATRHFDDKAPFLTQTAHLGRNFDEDERKPLDGLSAPRRMVSDDNFRASRLELKPESVSTGRVSGWQGTAAPLSSGSVTLYLGKVIDANNSGMLSQNVGGNNGHAASGSYPNAWAARRDVAVGVTEPVQSAWSGQTAVSKLAHASALEKVSSGRWQSKPSHHHHQPDVEVIKYSDPESILQSTNYGDSYSRLDVGSGKEYSDAMLAGHVERTLSNEEGVHGGRRDLPEYGRSRLPTYLEVKDRKPSTYVDGPYPALTEDKCGGFDMLPTGHSEPLERPKLKLLPRTKPLETLEIPVHDLKQGQLPSKSASHGRAEIGNELRGNVNPPKHVLAFDESVNQMVDRPKLNLKPRSQPLEHLEGNTERERNAVFGGARPRELVLKERGIEDVVINHELGQQSDRAKYVSKTERIPDHALASRHGERTENATLDQRTGRKFEKKESRGDSERVDVQRRNWRHENWKNSRENERQPQQQQQQQERHPSPETWRKPVEQPNPSSPDGLRYGKAASAVELAQAFSRSLSHPKADDRHPMQRSVTGRNQMPFSRLMNPTPRQINGY